MVFLLQSGMSNISVNGSSMDPTVRNGQLMLASKVFSGPERGEIVVVKGLGLDQRKLIKRVIGLPGETIEIHSGEVLINGRVLNEDYVRHHSTDSMEALTVPEDYYWVMGDNRTASTDSRVWGPIPEENILGSAWVSYWPITKWGLIN